MAPRQGRRGLQPNFLNELPVLVIILLVVCSCIVDAARSRGSNLETGLEHQGEWAIKLSPRTDETLESLANRVAADLGLISLGQVGELEGVYRFRHGARALSARSLRDVRETGDRISTHESVEQAYPQYVLRRYRRVLPAEGRTWHNHGQAQVTFKSAHASSPFGADDVQRVKQTPIAGVDTAAGNSTEWPTAFNDPSYYQQWFLGPGTNGTLNIQPVWARNITGKGVVVSVLDDGVEYTHPDLQRCYVCSHDAKASLDLNSRDKDPMPDTSKDINSHGTRCAGEIAAQANNSICSVGIAFNAKVGGVRMLDGYVTDADEAAAFSVAPQHVDIYSSSWGPDDDGATVEGPGPLAQAALLQGVTKGRGGKGNIYVFAGGNGGSFDDCNCDGYVNSPYTITVGAVLKDESLPWFAELCAAQLACAFGADLSSASGGIPTTDFRNGCTDEHGGTSAAAPQASAIFALALEQNANLTWRDMQYLVAVTSRPIDLDDTTWFTNGAGRLVSSKFGYGVLNADALVTAASEWKTLGAQIVHQVQAPMPPIGLVVDEYDGLTRSVVVAANDTKLRYLEQVQVFINLTSYYRGEMAVALVSPMGTRTVLLSPRLYDESKTPFTDWGLTTVQLFGERALGTWAIEVSDANQNDHTGQLTGWRLVLRGTATLCAHPLCKPVPRSNSTTQQTVAQGSPNATANASFPDPFIFRPNESALPFGAESPTSVPQETTPVESSASKTRAAAAFVVASCVVAFLK